MNDLSTDSDSEISYFFADVSGEINDINGSGEDIKLR